MPPGIATGSARSGVFRRAPGQAFYAAVQLRGAEGQGRRQFGHAEAGVGVALLDDGVHPVEEVAFKIRR